MDRDDAGMTVEITWDEDDRAHLPVLPKRRARVRSRTTNLLRYPKRELEAGAVEAAADLEGIDARRPTKRSECLQGPNAARPCPWVSCKWHLAYDVHGSRAGSIQDNFPGRELWELPDTCTLDVTDRGPQILDDIADRINVTRERARQIERRVLDKVAAAIGEAGMAEALRELLHEDPELQTPTLSGMRTHARRSR